MSRRRTNQLIGLGMALAVLLAVYLSFHPSLPGVHGYRITALMRTANQLRNNSPVRIAGVDVGRVSGIDKGPGNLTAVTLDIQDRGLPLHRDATIRVRPRLFLEGGYYVDLSPGTPTAPQLASGGTLGPAQTTAPVQLDQLLSTFDAPVRAQLRDSLKTTAQGLSGGGAKGLRDVAPELEPMLRDLAWVSRASQGTAPHDVSRLIAGASRFTGGLAADPTSLADEVTNLRITADALSADDHALGDTLSQLDSLVRAAPSGLRALDDALPILTRVAVEARPAIAIAPAALRENANVVAQLGSLVAPGVRERTVSGLRTTFVDLPTLVVNMSSLFPKTKPLSDCLRTHITPILTAVVPDGALSTGRPDWQDFAHSLVGLSSAFQDFDGNGYAVRYEFGGGPEGFSTQALPGIGSLSGTTASPLQSRPAPPATGQPPIRADVPCTTQPVPSLDTQARALP
jgi:phospholipid/cholesterol/gamma-HCH transport system substrate-binding protein